jgi:hypothetical protein
VDATAIIPFPPNLFEALARRVSELLAEQPPGNRYMDADAAAAYLGLPVKTVRTREWREREAIPARKLKGGARQALRVVKSANQRLPA